MYRWSPLYTATSVDPAIDSLTVAVTHAIQTAVPAGCIAFVEYFRTVSPLDSFTVSLSADSLSSASISDSCSQGH